MWGKRSTTWVPNPLMPSNHTGVGWDGGVSFVTNVNDNCNVSCSWSPSLVASTHRRPSMHLSIKKATPFNYLSNASTEMRCCAPNRSNRIMTLAKIYGNSPSAAVMSYSIPSFFFLTILSMRRLFENLGYCGFIVRPWYSTLYTY